MFCGGETSKSSSKTPAIRDGRRSQNDAVARHKHHVEWRFFRVVDLFLISVILFLVLVELVEAQAQPMDRCNFNQSSRAGCLCVVNATTTCVDNFGGLNFTFDNAFQYPAEDITRFPLANGSVYGYVTRMISGFNPVTVHGCGSAVSGYFPYNAFGFGVACQRVLGFCNPGRNVSCCMAANCVSCSPFSNCSVALATIITTPTAVTFTSSQQATNQAVTSTTLTSTTSNAIINTLPPLPQPTPVSSTESTTMTSLVSSVISRITSTMTPNDSTSTTFTIESHAAPHSSAVTSSSTLFGIIGALGGVLLLIAVALAIYCLHRRNVRAASTVSPPSVSVSATTSVLYGPPPSAFVDAESFRTAEVPSGVYRELELTRVINVSNASDN
jgi:hypothetical protein